MRVMEISQQCYSKNNKVNLCFKGCFLTISSEQYFLWPFRCCIIRHNASVHDICRNTMVFYSINQHLFLTTQIILFWSVVNHLKVEPLYPLSCHTDYHHHFLQMIQIQSQNHKMQFFLFAVALQTTRHM